MNQPPMEILSEKVDSRYSLVVCASKRARQLLEGAPRLVDVNSNKPVTIALHELAADKLVYERASSSIK